MIDSGTTAFMLVSAMLVVLMTPALRSSTAACHGARTW